MQTFKIGQEHIEIALASLKKTKELIYYAVQLTDAVQRGAIRPEHFEKCLIVPEPHSKNQFCIELDWTQYPEIFKQTADDAQVNIASYAILICKETYSNVLWIDEEKNADLYAAQMILKLVRDAMGHMRAESKGFAAPYWDINKKHRRILEIKELGIIFDAESVHGKQFKFSHLGGLTNFLKILNYLIKDLHERLLV
ncbi:MAG: hypothetical protein JSR57_08290 [Verrucomicrobia bacterium]|nr:hypothetical protein [Verrucomicrobiota bacterium]